MRAALQAEGYRVDEAESALAALRLITQRPPDLLILDLGLPDSDGKEVIAEIRGWSSLPIVVLSARDQEKEKIAELYAGVDDYLTKPFGVGEPLARIRVALRHRDREPSPDDLAGAGEFVAGPVRVDPAARRVFRDGEETRLTNTEFDLLALMIHNAGRALTHRYLPKKIWGPHGVGETHYLRLRRYPS